MTLAIILRDNSTQYVKCDSFEVKLNNETKQIEDCIIDGFNISETLGIVAENILKIERV